jgi:hypothetical protein
MSLYSKLFASHAKVEAATKEPSDQTDETHIVLKFNYGRGSLKTAGEYGERCWADVTCCYLDCANAPAYVVALEQRIEGGVADSQPGGDGGRRFATQDALPRGQGLTPGQLGCLRAGGVVGADFRTCRAEVHARAEGFGAGGFG